MSKTFDPRCQKLAELFLKDVPPEAYVDRGREKAVQELAQHIQDAIEIYLEVDLGVFPE